MAGMSEDNDGYWEQSDIKGLSMLDDEANDNSILGVSRSGAAILSQQLREGIKLDPSNSSPGQLTSTKRSGKFELSQLMCEKSLNAIMDCDNYESALSKSSLSPEEEVRILRRKVQARWETPDINVTLRNILLGRPYSLEEFRSLESKENLLNSAIVFGDGDAILEVVIFLWKTIKKSLFRQLMFKNPIAIKHFSHYLTTRMQLQELIDLLELMGMNEEAAMKQYSVACSNPGRQISRLNSCSMKFFNTSKDKLFVDLFIRLIEWQNVNMKDQVGTSVISCLLAMCKDRWQDGGALALSKEQSVTEKQFQWTALTARASTSDWNSIQGIFISKGWLGSKKLNPAIPVEAIVSQLHKYNAPSQVLNFYLEMVDDIETRLNIAKKFNCHKIVIDIFTSQRDRQSLLKYKSSLHSQTEENFYADNILRSTNIKWKN